MDKDKDTFITKNSAKENSVTSHRPNSRGTVRERDTLGSSAGTKAIFFGTFPPPTPKRSIGGSSSLSPVAEGRKNSNTSLLTLPPPRSLSDGNLSLASYPGRAKPFGPTSTSGGEPGDGDRLTSALISSPLTDSSPFSVLSSPILRSVGPLGLGEAASARKSFLTQTSGARSDLLPPSSPSLYHSLDRFSSSSSSTIMRLRGSFGQSSRNKSALPPKGKKQSPQDTNSLSAEDSVEGNESDMERDASVYPESTEPDVLVNGQQETRRAMLLPPSPQRSLPSSSFPSSLTNSTREDTRAEVLPSFVERHDDSDGERKSRRSDEKLYASAPSSPIRNAPPLLSEASHSLTFTPSSLGTHVYRSPPPPSSPPPVFSRPPSSSSAYDVVNENGKNAFDDALLSHTDSGESGERKEGGGERDESEERGRSAPDSFTFQRSHTTGALSASTGSLISNTIPHASVNGQMNAAFCLSPRTLRREDSLSAGSTGNGNQRHLLLLVLDQEEPAQKEFCDVSSPEERQHFLSYRCEKLLYRMTPTSIIRFLLPAIVACLEIDDEYHDQAEENSVELVAKCLPIVFEAVCPLEDLSMLAAFVMPLLHLCTGVERRSIPTVSEACCRITEKMPAKGVVEFIFPLVHQLRYSSCSLIRAVAAGMFPSIAGHIKALQMTNRTIHHFFSFFTQSTQDPSPIVREACVRALPKWAKVALRHRVPPGELLSSTMESLISDDFSDVVRFLLVDRLAELGAILGATETSRLLLPFFESAVKARCWRVRYRASRQLKAFTAQLPYPEETILYAVSRFCKDDEVEIRAVMAAQIGDFVQFVRPSLGKEKLFRHALRLLSDESRYVQLHAIANIAPFASIDEDIAEKVCRELSHAMQKSDDLLQEYAVRSVPAAIRIIRQANTVDDNAGSERGSSANRLPGIVGNHSGGERISSAPASWPHVLFTRETENLLQALAACLKCMSRSGTWRVREAVLPSIPEFALVMSPEQLGSMNIVLRQLLLDPISKVRKTAAETLRTTAECAGPSWASNMLNELLSGDLGTALQASYGWRLLTVQCLSGLLPTAAQMDPHDSRRSSLLERTLQLLVAYSEDRVPIIRERLAQALVHWHAWFESFSSTAVRPMSSGLPGGGSTSSASKRLMKPIGTPRVGSGTVWTANSVGPSNDVDPMPTFRSVVKKMQKDELVLPPQLTQLGSGHQRQFSGDASSLSSRKSSASSSLAPPTLRGVAPAAKRPNSASSSTLPSKNHGLKR